MHVYLNATSYEGPLEEGNSHAQIFLDEAHTAWVVKSVTSSRLGITHGRALFNEFVATRVAELLGLPVPQVAIMAVDDPLLNAFPELRTPASGSFSAGLHLATRYHQGITLRAFRTAGVPELAQRKVINKLDANGVVTFDTWLCNPDHADETELGLYENEGNLLFETTRPGELRLMMLDHGQAFTGDWHDRADGDPVRRLGSWPTRLMGHYEVFVRGRWLNVTSCVEWLAQIQKVTLADLKRIVNEVPAAWREEIPEGEVEKLLLYLLVRATTIEKIVYQEFATMPERLRRGVTHP
ncbi:HipA family kinase [Deinococcus sonorensis]|uniref:HipA family kinase n=2 Tax=Deinococcus sonorensis TaxID=309891 RepID=A0AAU7UGM5_9DEIO